MKIYIVNIDLIPDDKLFKDLTDEEVIQLCKQDSDLCNHDEYSSIDELAAYWNAGELFSSEYSYMRVIND